MLVKASFKRFSKKRRLCLLPNNWGNNFTSKIFSGVLVVFKMYFFIFPILVKPLFIKTILFNFAFSSNPVIVFKLGLLNKIMVFKLLKLLISREVIKLSLYILSSSRFVKDDNMLKSVIVFTFKVSNSIRLEVG